MTTQYLIIYLLAVGAIGVILLCTDKYKATHEKWRIKERTLHIWEWIGGIFLMLPTMYIIRHKNRKVAYNWISWTAFVLWIAGLVYWYGFRK